jgi:hypothetical protein
MSSVTVQKEIPGPIDPQWSAENYLSCLNKTAIYAVTRGMLPLLVMPHLTFLVDFIDAWLKREPDSAKKTVAALFDRWPQWSQRRIEGWVASPRIPNRELLFLLLIPFALPLIVVAPWEAGRAVLSSSWDVLRKGVRGVPPLVTAVVVVFVTGDAWRILGAGFTVRFAVLVFVFVLASTLFLIQRDCWEDIDAKPKEASTLLGGIKHERSAGFRGFTDCGIEPAPMLRPRGIGALWVYAGYWLLTAFALIVAAVFVSSALIVIGVILINRDETQTLANSVYVYQTFPGGVVVTKQLLSLSFSLGAFAAFFLVAAQRPSERRRFMNNVLVRYRQALLVYSIYWRARDQAAEWTRVPVHVRPPDRQRHAPVPESAPDTGSA